MYCSREYQTSTKFDTFSPVLGVQTCHAQCASVLLSVPAFTTTHTKEEEIEQIYESAHQATSFYEPESFEERFKKKYGKKFSRSR